jgi:predicted Zn-dependent protease
MERAVRASPGNAEYHYWLAKAYAGQTGGGAPWARARSARKAIHALERALSLDSTYDAAYAELIPIYAQLPSVLGGDPARADALLARWLRIRPYAAGLARVRFDVARNLPQQALADATALAQAFPDSARAHYEVAIAYQRTARPAESWPVIDRGLARWPDDSRLLFALGRGAAETGERLARGESALRRVIAAEHGVDDQLRANARYRLGRILERRGDRVGARAEYDGALALAPTLRDAKAARERVR